VEGEWGSPYAGVELESDGKIYAVGSATPLATYKLNVWYDISVDADLTARKSDVYINGVLMASGVPFAASGLPTGVELGAGHGNNPIVYFDNVVARTPEVSE
jgi:hypothetical protein